MSFKNTVLPVQTCLQSKGRLLDLSTPVVMGILNATPDSFYNKGRDSGVDDILRNAEKMLTEGAGILDIGGASTRPGSELIDPAEELKRTIPVIEAVSKRFPEAWLSADTYNAQVAEAAIFAGAHIINDVSSGGIDAGMIQTVARLKVPYVAMHMQGTPKAMQQNPQYQNVTAEIRDYLRNICEQCADAGITDIIVDPGFGFGKTVGHNFQLLKDLHSFRILGKPILVGLSRKSIVCRSLNVTPEHALNGTTALHMEALRQGASILRVHDVKEAKEAITLHGFLQ